MGKQLPVLVRGVLGLPDGNVIEVDTPEWQQWLGNPENRSFRFDDLSDSYTCRKERVRGVDSYWYAYRSIDGKTRSKYIGKSDALTHEKLMAVDFDSVATTKTSKLPKPLPSPLPNNVGNDLMAMLEAMNQRMDKMEKQLGEFRA